MVNISQIRKSNSQIDDSSAPRIAVFVGGASGIGKLTLAEIAGLGRAFKAYVVGRKSSEASFKAFAEALKRGKPDFEVVWIEAEVSLLSEAKRVCDFIKTQEAQIDLLFMTTGYAPFGGREDTKEGLEVSGVLRFYTRICFTENLLPLLRASGHARVISVGAAGMEMDWKFDVDDLLLEKPSAFGPAKAHSHSANQTTLILERLAEAKENRRIVFVNSHPGIVRTGNVFRGWVEGSWGAWFAAWVMDPLLRLFAFSEKESAERYLYQVTSGTLGGKGPMLPGVVGQTSRGDNDGGLFLVSKTCDTVLNEKALAMLRVKASDKVWKKTHEVIGPYVQ